MMELTILQYEEQQLQRELDALLKKELPYTINYIKGQLEKLLCKGYFETVKHKTKPLELKLKHEENHNIKGKLIIKDDKIMELELIAQMNNFNQKHLFQIQLAKEQSWTLEQLKILDFHLQKVVDLMNSFENANSKEDAFRVLQNIITLFDLCIKSISNVPHASLFPQKVCERKLITPTLPNDLSIQFYILKNQIHLNLIHYLPSLSGKNKRANKPQVVMGRDQMDIIDCLEIAVDHPGLKELELTMKHGRDTLLKFINHLQNF